MHSAFSSAKDPTGFPLGIPIKTCSNNRKIECSRGTMGRRKRREKASLLSFPFPSRFLFLSPQPPYILEDPGADSGDEGKSKRAGKYIWNEEK